MSERSARVILAGIVAALFTALAGVDLPSLSNGAFWSDGATYYAMTRSLVEDGDLRYEARDVLRVRREFSQGPGGIFLKRCHGGLTTDGVSGFPWFRRVEAGEGRIYFAKAAAYPFAAAPFVKAFGTQGFLFANAFFLSLALVLGYSEARRRCSPGTALALSCAVFLAGVTPLYLIWLNPETFNVGVVMAGLWAWRRERPWLSALLLGIATYSKPTHVFLALPLGVAPLLVGSWSALGRGLRTSIARGVVLVAVALSFYGLNILVTGEWNYQGGERKTFLGPVFPFEAAGVTFGNSGIWMTTNRIGPAVEGEEGELGRGEVALSAEELRGAFLRNLGYFWYGRYGGAALYFPALVLGMLAFLLLGPRERDGWLALGSVVVSWLFYIHKIPANWYGGGGTVGNRYLLGLLPIAVYLAPVARARVVSVLAAALAAWALWPVALAPMEHTLHPGRHAKRLPFTALPAELTMLNDLSFNIDAWRKKQRVGDTEGNAWRGWPPDPKSFWLYFPDDGTWGREVRVAPPGEERGPAPLARGQEEGAPRRIEGFWLRGGQRAEVLLRALEPVRKLTVRLHGGPAGDEVDVELGGRRERLAVPAGGFARAEFEPGPGFLYYESFVHVLRFRSARGAVRAEEARLFAEPRARGAFVEIGIEVARRRRAGGRPG